MDYKVEKLLPIVSKLARKYAGCENTSISYEKAQMLMEAVIYCMDEYWNSSSAMISRRDISVEEQYTLGSKLVMEKAGQVREMFNELAESFEDYGVKCLYDTVQRGIPEFLKWYDAKFCPQDTILTLDYPVSVDLSPYRGVDAVHYYLRSILAEQRFLRRFGGSYVRAVLQSYNSGYGGMYENVCEILLGNALGHMVIQKPFQEMGFKEEEYAVLSKRFQEDSLSGMEDRIRYTIQEMVRQYYQSDEQLLEYLCCGAGNLAVRIDMAFQSGRPDTIFLL